MKKGAIVVLVFFVIFFITNVSAALYSGSSGLTNYDKDVPNWVEIRGGGYFDGQITGMAQFDGKLFVLSGNSIYSWDGENLTLKKTFSFSGNNLVASDSLICFVAVTSQYQDKPVVCSSDGENWDEDSSVQPYYISSIQLKADSGYVYLSLGGVISKTSDGKTWDEVLSSKEMTLYFYRELGFLDGSMKCNFVSNDPNLGYGWYYWGGPYCIRDENGEETEDCYDLLSPPDGTPGVPTYGGEVDPEKCALYGEANKLNSGVVLGQGRGELVFLASFSLFIPPKNIGGRAFQKSISFVAKAAGGSVEPICEDDEFWAEHPRTMAVYSGDSIIFTSNVGIGASDFPADRRDNTPGDAAIFVYDSGCNIKQRYLDGGGKF